MYLYVPSNNKQSYLLRVDTMSTAKLMSSAYIGSCVGVVMFTSVVAMLLVWVILSVTLSSFTDEDRLMA